MIWLILVAVVFVVGGAWLVARSMMIRGIVVFAGLAAVGAYALIGRPSMPDKPLQPRIAEIVERVESGNINDLSLSEMVAYAEQQVKKDPTDPRPHIGIGIAYELQGRPQKAAQAYDEALRRDPTEIEAIRRLADLRFKMSGEIDETTSALYHEWYRREPDNLRVGYMAGLGDWTAGRKDEARKRLAEIDAKTPQDSPYPQMFAALRQMFRVDPPAPEAQPQKPPK